MQALILVGGRGHPPAPADPDGAQAGHPARRPAVHPLHDRLARSPRGRRHRDGVRLPPRPDARRARRRGDRWPAAALRRGAGAARHRGRDQVRRGAARRPLLRPQRRHPHRPRPDGADRAARGARARRRRSALYPVEDPSASGSSGAGEDGEILEFLEKPEPAEIDTDEIYAGIYVLEHEVLDLVPEARDVSIEREVFPQLVGDGPLRSQRLDGLLDGHRDAGALPAGELGHPRAPRRDRARRRWSTTAGSWSMTTPAIDGAAAVDAAGVRRAAREDRRRRPDRARAPWSAAGCELGEGATVEGSVLHPACRVGAGARSRGAILAARRRGGRRRDRRARSA